MTPMYLFVNASAAGVVTWLALLAVVQLVLDFQPCKFAPDLYFPGAIGCLIVSLLTAGLTSALGITAAVLITVMVTALVMVLFIRILFQ